MGTCSVRGEIPRPRRCGVSWYGWRRLQGDAWHCWPHAAIATQILAPDSYPLTVGGLIEAEPIDAASIDLLVGGVLGAWSVNHETAIRDWYDRYRQGFSG